jgi:hypothetical protein
VKILCVHLLCRYLSDLAVQTGLTGVTYRSDRSSINMSDRCDTGLTGLKAENSDFDQFVSNQSWTICVISLCPQCLMYLLRVLKKHYEHSYLQFCMNRLVIVDLSIFSNHDQLKLINHPYINMQTSIVLY